MKTLNPQPIEANVRTPRPTLPHETLLELGTIHAQARMAELFEGDPAARGVQAGLVSALLAILPPDQFRQVMVQWEVDPIRQSELLHLSQFNAE